MVVAGVRQYLEADLVRRGYHLDFLVKRSVWGSPKQDLLFVLESLVLLSDDALSEILCFLRVCWKLDRHEVLLLVFAELFTPIELWGLGEEIEVTTLEFLSVGYCKLLRAIFQMVIVILVLLTGLHERHWIAYFGGHRVKDEAWTLT